MPGSRPRPIYQVAETGAGKEMKRNREEKKQSENTTSNCLERAEVGGCDSNPGKKLLSVPLTFSEVKIASFSGKNKTQPPHQFWPCLKLLLRKPRCERKTVKESLSRNSWAVLSRLQILTVHLSSKYARRRGILRDQDARLSFSLNAEFNALQNE